MKDIKDSANQAKNNFNSAAATASKQFDSDVVNTAGKKASDAIHNVSRMAGDLGAKASNIATSVKDVSGEWMDDSVSFVKRYPVYSVLGAAALGFAAAILTRPRSAR